MDEFLNQKIILSLACNPIYPDENIQMLGVVCCGGKSVRMGTDKGLIKQNGITRAEKQTEKLEAFSIGTCISINIKQKEAYSSLFLEEKLVIDCFPIEGPLAGILSVHNAFPYHDLLVIACDLIDVGHSLIERLLLALREREGEHDFFVFENEGQLEPLLGIYTREGLQKIADLYSLNKLEKLSMKYMLELGNTYFLRLGKDEVSQLKNYNLTL